MLNVVKHLRRAASQGCWYQTLRSACGGAKGDNKKAKGGPTGQKQIHRLP